MDKYEYLQAIKWLNEQTEKYDAGTPQVSDKEWDAVYFQIQKYENDFPENISIDSPTQKIHYKEVSELKKVKHNHLMLSLNKTKSINELHLFLGDEPYVLMAKLDGLTCSLHYEKGYLVSAETRGNGEVGEDITHNALVISSIPKRIDYAEPLTIDGEIICTYSNFDKWKDEYKNPRNFASGSIRLLNSKECSKRGLTFVAWDVIENNNFEYFYEKITFLSQLNFKIVPILKGNNTIKSEIEDIKNQVNGLYPIDGIVIKYDSIQTYNKAGRTDHHFKGGIAYKFYDELYDTRLKTIEWTMGRTGILTPVAIFDPINIDDTIVERASLHNVSVMRDVLGDCAYVGEPLKVYKANQIIPQIAEAGPKYNYGYVISHGGVSANDCPEFCPICNGEIYITKSEAGIENMCCENPTCPGKLINRVDHFLGKKGLDVKGVSKKTIEKLIEWEWLNDLTDIPKLKNHRKDWINKSGFGVASVDKIIKNIDDRFAEAPLSGFIAGIGIPLVGSTIAKEICKRVETWTDFKKLINENFDFTNWDGFGEELNSSLHNFDYEEADTIIDSITFKLNEVKIENNIDNVSNTLQDVTFVITGKLALHKNRQELVDEIERAGGKVQSNVSSKTMYLINNDINSTSAKNNKAKELNIPIITEQEFMEMLYDR